jgi:hypothetical protein
MSGLSLQTTGPVTVKEMRLKIYSIEFTRSLVALMVSLPMAAEAAMKQSDAPVSDAASTNTAAGASVETIGEGVAGVVVDANGAPISGALIQPSATGGSSPVPDMAVMSGADGRFTWRLQPGSYRVDAIVDGRVVASANVRVTGGVLTRIQLSAGQ